MADVDTLVTYVPIDHTEMVLAALFEAGAGQLGNYRECAFVTRGRGQFRPVDGANPAIGSVGKLEVLDEDRIEVMVPADRRAAVIDALRAAHPYEEPAYYVIPA
ncbi:MAG TPA: YqfO family protein [Ilumatobacteraceae bacterium]|nr:YqfO family protein [Ilumatobacteraceae bacterium]